MPPKSRLAVDSDVTSILASIKKWLGSQDVRNKLNLPGEDLPDLLKHGLLFLNGLRLSRHFPGNLTPGESSLLQVIEELSSKVDHSAEGASSGGPSKAKGASKRKKEDEKENESKGKSKVSKKAKDEGSQKAERPGPKSTKKLAPLSKAALNQVSAKGCSCKGECKTKTCGCVKKSVQCGTPCKCLNTCVNGKKEPAKMEPAKKEPAKKEPAKNSGHEDEDEDDDEHDAGKEATGPAGSNFNGTLDDEEDEHISDDGSEDDIGNETVNWDLHITSLVECQKCKRKFFPERIAYHARVCKNV